MSITHVLDRDRRFMHTTAVGPVTYRDIQAHLDEEARAGALGYDELIDARAAEVRFSGDEVRSLVERLRQEARREPLGPTAVAVGSEVAYGMGRMFGVLVEGVCDVAVFRGLEPAE